MAEPLDDDQIKALVAAATKPTGSKDSGNAATRIVKAVERYHGVDGTESMCPMCGRPVSAAPCSMNSDGAFHLAHPHNPSSHMPRLFRFKGGA